MSRRTSLNFSPSKDTVMVDDAHNDNTLSPASSCFEEALDEKQGFNHEDNFPDGGRQAWTTVGGAFFGLTSVFGVLNSVGAIEAYIRDNQLREVPTSTISWIFSIYTFMLFFSGIFCGCFFDRNGCSYINYVGSAFSIVGLYTLAVSTEVWHFVLSFSLCYGLGSGILLTSLISAASTWFKKRSNTAQGLISLGGSFGGIVFPVMLRRLYSEIGFANAIRVLASILSLFLILSCILTKENSNVVDYVENRSRRETKKEVLKVYVTDLINLKYLLEPKFFFCTLGCACAESGTTVAATYFASYCIHKDYTQTQSYTFVTVINAFGILGRSSGWLADRYTGRYHILSATMLLASIFCFVLWLPFGEHMKVMYAYCALYGCMVSGFLSLAPAAVGAISRIEEFGKRFSTMYFFVSVFCIPILEIAGVIIGDSKSQASFDHYVIFCSCILLVGAASYIITRVLHLGLKAGKF
ncbi:hypothetical protein ACO0QE_003081 [Hanseniaspora vineae]